jgi:hypothetical protein
MFLLGAMLGAALLRRPGLRTSAVLLQCPVALPLAMLAGTVVPAGHFSATRNGALHRTGTARLWQPQTGPPTQSKGSPHPAEI